MISGRNVRQMLKEAKTGAAFKSKLRELLGVKVNPVTGKGYVDHQAQQINPQEFSVRALTEEFLGHQFISELHEGPPSSSFVDKLVEARGSQQRALFEDVAGVGPSVFQDINAWNASIGGLVEVRLLEGYNRPDFIGDEFVTTEPTRVNGGKIQGIPYVAPRGEVVQPGVEFPNVGMNELWVWARPNMTIGMKLGLDRNTVVYDLGGELMNSAESVGAGLGYEKEYIIAAGVMGLNRVVSSVIPSSVTKQIGDSFRMNATIDSTPNPTYQTAGVTTNPNLPNAYNFINSKAANTLVDWTNLQAAQQLLNLMRDPVNGLPFKTEIKKVLVDAANWQRTLYIRRQQEIMLATGTPATSPTQGAGSTFPPNLTTSAGQQAGSQLYNWTPHYSNIWHQVLLDAGISEANAQIYWYAGDPQKSFVWRSAWDIRVDQANPSGSELLGRNIVNEWVTQFSGQFVVREPRFVIQSTN
jgi:hypothetical protein